MHQVARTSLSGKGAGACKGKGPNLWGPSGHATGSCGLNGLYGPSTLADPIPMVDYEWNDGCAHMGTGWGRDRIP
jgi:hypothetical protein